MSLGNENDIIIPGTTGIITAAKNEANQFNINEVNYETRDKYLAEQIRKAEPVYNILNGRANGIELINLVDPSRIASSQERTTTVGQQETTKEGTVSVRNSGRFYEDWMGRE